MISKEQIRAFVATPKGKLAVACLCLVLCWIFLLLYFFSDSLTAFGDPKSLKKAKDNLAKLEKTYREVRGSNAGVLAKQERYRKLLASAYKEGDEDKVKTVLHNKITEAANKLEFKLSRISSVNINRLNSELYYAEVDVTAEGKLDEIVALINALEAIDPKPVWKQLELRPDNRPRPQVSTGVDSLNLANQDLNVERTQMTMRGTLRVLCADETANTATPKTPRKRK